MRNSMKKFQRTWIFLLKALLFVSLFASFFLLLSFENPQLLRFSRTAGVTMVSFTILEISLMTVYGGYSIGKQNSKSIVRNLILATILTDLVTHFQLSIMNTNDHYNEHFRFADPQMTFICMVLQVMLIIIFTYAGNYMYHRINPPERSAIITSSQDSLNQLLTKLKRLRRQYHITCVLDYTAADLYDSIKRCQTVFLYDVPIEERTQIVEHCYEMHKNVYYNPELCDVVSMGATFIMMDDKPMISSYVKELAFEQRLVKRSMDVILSLVGIILTSPVMLFCAIAIIMEDHGSILFKQQRATKNGAIFKVFKFRTMRVAKPDEVHVSATDHDDRITKAGAVLRKFRIDELPQLFNILRGEMSIVGPRPEMLENVYRYTEDLPEFEYRLRVKAGLTGLAQVVGKYNTSPKDKLMLDLMYIEQYSLGQDVKLIFQTLLVFLKSSDSTEGFKEDKVIEFKKYNTTKKDG